MKKHYQIAPSLLSANFAKLGEECQAVLNAGADMLHLDVMDNHYVPNLTIGPLVCAALRNFGITAPIDVHLMTNPVDRLILDFAKAGASHITFHPDATNDVLHSLNLIQQHGCKAGLALNPETSWECLPDLLDKLDIILVMTVNPGFGGQAFIPEVLDKIKKIRTLIDGQKKPISLAVDGGVKIDNIKTIAKAGGDTFVAGSAIFSQPNYAAIISSMRENLAEV